MKEKIANTLRIIIVSFLLSTAIGYSLANWAPPPPCGAPPCGNTPPPINVGPATQMREGLLLVNNRVMANSAFATIPVAAGDPGNILVTKDYLQASVAVASSPTCIGYPSGCEEWVTATCPAGKKAVIGSCNGYGGGPANTYLFDGGKSGIDGWACYIWSASAAANGVTATTLCF